MGALEELAQALVAQNAEANQLIAQEDPYLRFKQAPDFGTQLAMGYATKDPGRFKSRDLIAAALLSGLGSGISEGLSQDYQGRAKDAYGDVFMGREDRPDVLSPGLFRNAREQSNLFRLRSDAAQAQRAADIQDAITKDRFSAQAKIEGENAAYGFDPYAAPAVMQPGALPQSTAPTALPPTMAPVADPLQGNPNSPQYKVAKTERDRRDAAAAEARSALKTTPLATAFADVKTNFDALTQYAAQKGGPAKLAAISSFARILDPNSVVREGEIRNVENTQAFLQQLGTSIENLVSNKNDLPLPVKRAMLAAAAEKYNAFGKDYQSLVEKWQATAGRQGARPEDVFGAVEYSPFELSAWDKAHPGIAELPLEATTRTGSMKASDLLAQGYTKTDRGWVKP